MNTVKVEPAFLRGFIACRLIPLDKDPGVRPIGIGEVARRIVSNATITLLKPDLIKATAPLQTCAGLKGGIDPETEAILIVDATNAFNILCREAALHNIKFICPELSTFVKICMVGK